MMRLDKKRKNSSDMLEFFYAGNRGLTDFVTTRGEHV